MAIEHSRNAVVNVGDGASPEVFNELDKQLRLSLNLSGGQIDTSNKTTGNFREFLAGLRNFQVSVGMFINWPDTNGFERVRTQATAGNQVNIEVELNAAANKYTATTEITDFTINAAEETGTGADITFANALGAPVYA